MLLEFLQEILGLQNHLIHLKTNKSTLLNSTLTLINEILINSSYYK